MNRKTHREIIVSIQYIVYVLGMCISITDADAIHISMHSQRYNTLKIHMKQLPMQCKIIHPSYDAVWSNCDSTQCDSMQYILHYIYYIYQTLLSKATYSAFRLYIFFYQYVCFLGIEPTTFCTANAMLYHWATGTQCKGGGKYDAINMVQMVHFYFFGSDRQQIIN